MEVAQQALEETRYWLELLTEGGFVDEGRLGPLFDETDQLIAILAASTATAKRRS